MEAADWAKPNAVFEYTTASDMSRIFHLGGNQPEKYIRRDLDGLVKEAAKLINEAFATAKREVEDGDGSRRP